MIIQLEKKYCIEMVHKRSLARPQVKGNKIVSESNKHGHKTDGTSIGNGQLAKENALNVVVLYRIFHEDLPHVTHNKKGTLLGDAKSF